MKRKGTVWIIAGLLVGSVLTSATPAQAVSRWDPNDLPNDLRGRPDVRRARIPGCCPYWITVLSYERWLGPATSGLRGGRFVIELEIDDDRRTDFRVRMRADTDGLRCGLFRGGERADRGTAIRADHGYSFVCGLSLMPVIDDRDRWRVLAFGNHKVTDRAPDHGRYQGSTARRR